MGIVVILLIAALVVVTLLWREERRRNETEVESYALDLLREHNNLTDALRELQQAEQAAVNDMEAAVKNGH